jgi:regulator of replication initiation timing
MSDLEIQVSKLMEENKRLQRENNKLKERSSVLLTENSSLRERLGTDGSLVKMEEETSGSAASSVSLPWGQTPSPSQPMMPYVLTLW